MSVPVSVPKEVDEEAIQRVLEDLGKSADQIWNGQIGQSEKSKQKRARALGSARTLAQERLIDLGVDECNAEELVRDVLRDAAKPHLKTNRRKEGP